MGAGLTRRRLWDGQASRGHRRGSLARLQGVGSGSNFRPVDSPGARRRPEAMPTGANAGGGGLTGVVVADSRGMAWWVGAEDPFHRIIEREASAAGGGQNRKRQGAEDDGPAGKQKQYGRVGAGGGRS